MGFSRLPSAKLSAAGALLAVCGLCSGAPILSGDPGRACVGAQVQKTLHPPPGANDLYLEFWTKDARITSIAEGPKINQGGVAPPPPPPPPINPGPIPADPAGGLAAEPRALTWVPVKFKNTGGAPYTDPVTVSVKFCLDQHNSIRERGYWTYNDTPIPPSSGSGGGGGGAGGWEWTDPFPGPNGFCHMGIIYNDETFPVLVRDIFFFGSPTGISADAMNNPSIDWGGVRISSVIIPPESAISFLYCSPTPMIGEWIFLKYRLFLNPDRNTIPDEEVYAGHPIPPSPGTAAAMLTGLVFASRRRR